MNYDIVIIGAGPAGYVAAIRAGQAGLKTLVIDKRYVGGMCLNWGCIPTKALLESAKLYKRIKSSGEYGITGIDQAQLSFSWEQARLRAASITGKLSRGIEFLWKKHGVEFIKGEAVILSPTQVEVENRIVEAKHILIATGSRPSELKLQTDLPIIGIEALLTMSEVPFKPVIYGQGPVAIELAQFYQMIDRKPVLIVPERPLIPDADDYVNQYLEKKFKKDKLQVIYGMDWKLEGNKLQDGNKEYEVDAVINANLRRGILPKSKVDIAVKDGFITVNDHLQTNVETIYAIGDVNGKSYLAHAASAHGLAAVNHILGLETTFEPSMYPLNIYSEPEIAQVGLTEQQIKAQGTEYKISEFSLAANGKAMTEGNSEGSIRILSETKYGQVLGVQIIAANATDMIAEAGVLLELEGTVYDLARTVHAHPTVSEVFMEVGMVGIDQPVHK